MVYTGGGGNALASLLSVLSKFSGQGKGGGWGKGGGKGGKGGGDKTLQKLKGVEADRKVWIGNLPNTVTWKDLEKHFQTTGAAKPKITELMKKGTAVAAFNTPDEAAFAIAAANGTELKGKNIEVDVWSSADSGKKDLVAKIKEMQKSSDAAKKQWWDYCDENLGGVHDPKKHDASVLETFFAIHPFESKAPTSNEYVKKIKEFQRSSAENKKLWWKYSDENLGGVHDPAKHDQAVLQQFLLMNGVA
jgi:RNA recognition motif-containing protein